MWAAIENLAPPWWAMVSDGGRWWAMVGVGVVLALAVAVTAVRPPRRSGVLCVLDGVASFAVTGRYVHGVQMPALETSWLRRLCRRG